MPFLLVISYIVAEVYTFSWMVQRFGFGNVFFFLLVTAFIGLGVAKNQGRHVLLQMQGLQASLQRGQTPIPQVLPRLLVFIGGVLFVVPGFLAHALGLLLLLPGSRHLLAFILGRKLKTAIQQGKLRFGNNVAFGSGGFGKWGGFQVFTSGTTRGGSRAQPWTSDETRDVTPKVIDVQPLSSTRRTESDPD